MSTKDSNSEQPCTLHSVNSSLFLDVVKEFGYPMDIWVNKESWRLHIYNDEKEYVFCLDFTIRETEAYVRVGGVGACQNLIAKTPDELRENIKSWIRHRV